MVVEGREEFGGGFGKGLGGLLRGMALASLGSLVQLTRKGRTTSFSTRKGTGQTSKTQGRVQRQTRL